MPNAKNLHPWLRIALGLVVNVVLARFLIPNLGIISNTENKYYEPINAPWQWTASLGSLIALMALVPVSVFSKRPCERWVAFILMPLPLLVAFGEWFQWLDFITAHGLASH